MQIDPPLTIKQMRTIGAVANHASLARASEQLHASQSSLSRHIAEAERSLGWSLFQRGWHGMEPTSEGEVVIARCQQVMAAIASAHEALDGPKGRGAELAGRLTWHLLDVVEAVRTTGGASAAAAYLNISQSEVSRALTKVAVALGRQPFQRTRTGLTALPDVAILMDLRRTLSAAVLPLPDQLAALSREVTGRVAVGLLPFSEQDVVAKVFGRMLEVYSHVRLLAVTGSYAALTDGLSRGELDFVLGPMRNPPPMDTLEETYLLDEHFAVVVRAGHPLAQGRPSLRKLAQQNWVVGPHGTPIRRYFEDLLISQELPLPTHTCEIVTFYLAEQVLLNSDAVGFLTYSDRKRMFLREDLRLLSIALPENVRQIGVTTRKGQQMTRAHKAFMELMKDLVER